MMMSCPFYWYFSVPYFVDFHFLPKRYNFLEKKFLFLTRFKDINLTQDEIVMSIYSPFISCGFWELLPLNRHNRLKWISLPLLEKSIHISAISYDSNFGWQKSLIDMCSCLKNHFAHIVERIALFGLLLDIFVLETKEKER